MSFNSETLVEWLLILLRERSDSPDTTIQEIINILSLKNEEKGVDDNIRIVNMLDKDNVKALTHGNTTVFAVLEEITSYLTPDSRDVWHKLLVDEESRQLSDLQSKSLYSSEVYSSDSDSELFAPRIRPPTLPASAHLDPLGAAAQASEEEPAGNDPVTPPLSAPQLATVYAARSVFSVSVSQSEREARAILEKWPIENKISYLTNMLQQVGTSQPPGYKEDIGQNLLLGIPWQGTPNPAITLQQGKMQTRLIYDGSRLLVSLPSLKEPTENKKNVNLFVTQCLKQLSAEAFLKYSPKEGVKEVADPKSCTIQ